MLTSSVVEPTSQVTEVPAAARGLLEEADFVVSTWFCSIISPFCIGLRAKGQRWVKITYFRDLDLLYTPQARFPADLVGELIRATASRLPDSSVSEIPPSGHPGGLSMLARPAPLPASPLMKR